MSLEEDKKYKLASLKRKRNLLQKEKDKLLDKSMDKEEKSMYYFGLGIVTVVGGLLFYSSSPVLVGLIPIVYAVSLPTIRLSSMYKKELTIINKLIDLDKEINILDEEINNSEVNNKAFINEKSESNSLPLNYNYSNYDTCESIVSDKSDVLGPRLVKRKK